MKVSSLVDDCVLHLNYSKIRSYMKSIKWRWMTTSGYVTPTKKQLREGVRETLLAAVKGARLNKQAHTCQTGGIECTAHYKDGRISGVSAAFQLDRWDSYRD